MVDINKKISNIINLPTDDRYDYFIRKIVDFEEVWGLYNENGWAMIEDEENNHAMPFWSEKEFAEICVQDEWKEYNPKSISLIEFIEKWLVGMHNDNLKVVVFYIPKGKGISIYPYKVKEDLEEELGQYE